MRSSCLLLVAFHLVDQQIHFFLIEPFINVGAVKPGHHHVHLHSHDELLLGKDTLSDKNFTHNTIFVEFLQFKRFAKLLLGNDPVLDKKFTDFFVWICAHAHTSLLRESIFLTDECQAQNILTAGRPGYTIYTDMKKLVFSLCAALALAVVLLSPASSQKKKFTYVGITECKKCHGTSAIGNQIRAWEGTLHSKAYRNLRTERGIKVAEKAKVASPSEDQQCIRCHSPSGAENPSLASEGVGCEACHGPASEYVDLSNHGALGDKEKDYARATSHGMYKVLGYGGIKLRERMCRRCHTLDRPCIPDDIEERKRQDLSLSVIADHVFKHSLK
jgi:hypothetical protein